MSEDMKMFSSAASTSSRGSASESEAAPAPSRLKNVGSPDGDDERNDFDETHKIQAGIFSVLYILSKEKMNENLKFTIIKLMFDFTQLFALVVNPAHGWRVNSTSVYWQILTFSRWNYIVTELLGYKVFVAILYTMTGMLMSALGLCVWIAYSYKNRSFAYTWPIYILRIYATIHFGLFDIATLTLIQVSYDCQFLGSGASNRGHMYTFPEKVCYSSAHLVPFVIGMVTQVIFVVAAVIFFTGEFEVNPISRRFTCCAHSHVEVRAFLLKVAMTVVYVLVGWLQVQTAVQAFLCLALTWIFFKNMPYMFAVINHIRVGSYLAVSWAGILAVAIMFKPHGDEERLMAYERRITDMMLYGLGPIALVGFAASYLRLHSWSRFVLKRFKEAPPGSKVKDIYRFKDPIEVEIISRVARHWIDDEVLDMERVKEAEAIIKAGLVLFPTHAFMIMLYSNFLWDVLDNPQAGYSQLQAAKKANPNYMERFAIYRREQQHLARTAQTKGNGESTLDLVSYVEFQRNYRLAMRAHREALIATRNFWQYLLQQHITFTHLSKSLNAIEGAIIKADKVYRTVLERYPYSAKMIKGYARFLEGVKNDPWRASKFYTEAEKLEAEREEEAAALELEGMDGDDSRLLNKVDERVNAVIIINSRGQVQMANKLAYAMFGYSKGELEGKNVAMLMPLPFSQRHNGYIKRHITTGRETVMNRVTELVALHKDRYVFPFRLAVSKVSGAGDDSLFMGVIMGVDPPDDTANVYILSGGSVAAVDQAFVDWFGYTVEDYLGHPVHTLAVDPVPFKRLVEEVTHHDQPTEDGMCPVYLGAKHALIKHKYTDPVDVSLRLKATGVGTETIYRVEMRRNQPPVELVLTNRKGRICFITSPLSRTLGHSPRSLRKVDIGELLPQPFGALHAAWIREAAESKPSPHSCRSGVTMILGPTPKTQQPVRLAVKSTDESGEQQHVVKISMSSLAEGLDERRLRVTMDTAGVVTDVSQSPTSLFGFKPTALLGRSFADCIDVLHNASRAASMAMTAAGGGAAAADAAAAAELRKIITLLMGRALERPGMSWRVGVMPPLENIRSLGSIATALLAKQTRPAVMELDVKVDLEDLAAGRDVSINISLWRADLVCGILEVDKEGMVLTSQDHPFYPTGVLFGLSSPSLLRQNLGRFLQLGGHTIESLFTSESKSGKKGALKSSSAPPKKVGPMRTLNGFHSDGETLPLTVQPVRKDGANSRSYVVLHFKDPTRGSRDFLMHLQRGPVEPRALVQEASDGSGVTGSGVATVVTQPSTGVQGPGKPGSSGALTLTTAGKGEKSSRRRSVEIVPPPPPLLPAKLRSSLDMESAAVMPTLVLGRGSPRLSPVVPPPPLMGVSDKAALPPPPPSAAAVAPPATMLPGTPMAGGADLQVAPVPPPAGSPPYISQLRGAVGCGSGGSADLPSISTPPKDDTISPCTSALAPANSSEPSPPLAPPLPPAPPALMPPPPLRVVMTPAMDQPRVVGRGGGGLGVVPLPSLGAVGAAAGAGAAASRWSMAPLTPGSSEQLHKLDGSVVQAVAADGGDNASERHPTSTSLPPGVAGLTLADYLTGRPVPGPEDLASLFEKVAATGGNQGANGVGDGTGSGSGSGRAQGDSGGSGSGSGSGTGPTWQRQRPSVRRMAPNGTRPTGPSNLGLEIQPVGNPAGGAAAFAGGGDGTAGGTIVLYPPFQGGVTAAAAAATAMSPFLARPGSPSGPPPPPGALAVQQLAQQVPGAAAGLSALTAAVARAKTPPLTVLPPSSPPPPPPLLPVSPIRPPPPAAFDHSTASNGSLSPEPVQHPPMGGGRAVFSAAMMALRRVGSSGDQKALTRTGSRDSLATGSAQLMPPARTRSMGAKQVSFAPSQLMIDESGNIERQPSQPQMSLSPRTSAAVKSLSMGRRGGDDGRLDGGNASMATAPNGVGAGGRRLSRLSSGAAGALPPSSPPSQLAQTMYGGGGGGFGYGGASPGVGDDGAGAYGKIRSNVKLARIREWVMTEGERYFRLEDVQDIGDTVYPFGPDLLMREDSRASHTLVLNGGARGDDDDGDGGDDEADAAPSRWAEADGADDANDMRDLMDEDGMSYGAVMLESAPRDIIRGAKDGKFAHHGGSSTNGGGVGVNGGGGGGDGDDEMNGGLNPGSNVDDSEVSSNDDSRSNSNSVNAGQQPAPGGGAGVVSSSAQADFRRGKRFRKLLKMLSTPTVRRATLAFRWQALLAIAVQLLANLACFVLLTVLLIRQTRGLKELNSVGQAVVSSHDAMLALQVMDNIYSNRSQAGVGLYDRESIGRMVGELKDALDASWKSHNDVYLGTNTLQQLPSSYNLSALWNGYNHQELLFYGPNATDQRSTTLWRLGNAFLRQGFELHHRHSDLVTQLGALAASDQYKYIHSNGLFELFRGYQLTLNAFVYQAVDTSNTINQLQLVLLVIEGCCICALVVAYMAWLLKKVDNQRYGMYGVFLIVPVGLVRGLASKPVAVEEENSDGEEDNHDDEGGGDLGNGVPAGLAPGGPHHHHGGDNGGMRINLDAGGGPSGGRRNSSSTQGLNGGGRLRSLYDRIAFWRHGSVRHGKRTMLRNSKESLWLLAPFVVWGLVVVIMHSLGYVTMEKASAPVAMTNVVNTALTRVHRVVYFAQELCTATSVEDQQALYPVLLTEVAELKAEWDVMLYGANASQIADPHFALARRGIAFEMGATTSTLFSAGVTCWMPFKADCYPADHPYAAVVYRGLNAMVQRFFVEADLMLRDTPAAWTLNSSRLDYLYHEGTGNMHWAMYHLTSVHLDSVVSLYMRVEVFHVVVFVLSWLLAGLFLFGMLRPFMGHTKRETERIAEMLSQLPADVDVEGLLNKALISIKASEQRAGRNRVVPLAEPFSPEQPPRASVFAKGG